MTAQDPNGVAAQDRLLLVVEHVLVERVLRRHRDDEEEWVRRTGLKILKSIHTSRAMMSKEREWLSERI